MKQKSFKKAQNGRTLLELLAVLVVIALLTILGISDFRYAISKNDANTIYEDVLTQADHIQHKTGATGKSIFDSAVGKKTRSGLQMHSIQEGATFSIVVYEIPQSDCNALSSKNWSQNNIARIKINDKEYAPDAIECENINTNFKLTVVFWSNFASEADKSDETILPRLCNKGCLECQTCENNVCQDICEEGNICTSTEDSPNGVCIVDLGGRQICELDEDLSSGCYCPEGRDISNDTCGDCLAIENYQPWTQPILTSNGSFGSSNFAVKASSEQDSTRKAWRAFDNQNNDPEKNCWHSTQATTKWISWYTKNPIKINSLTIHNRGDGGAVGCLAVKDFQLQYSDNNSSWQTAFSGTNPSNAFYASYTQPINTISAHKYWRLNIVSVYGPNGDTLTDSHVAIGELTINADELQTTERILDLDTLLCE